MNETLEGFVWLAVIVLAGRGIYWFCTPAHEALAFWLTIGFIVLFFRAVNSAVERARSDAKRVDDDA